MKKLTTLFFALLTLSAFSQQNKKVKLEWKIEPNDSVVYKTIFDPIVLNTNEKQQILNFNSDEYTELKEKLSETTQSFTTVNKETVYKGKRDYIDLIMTESESKVSQVTEKTDIGVTKKNVSSVVKTVALRGSVYREGNIHSFWVQNDQKNIIAFIAQLPTEPVAIGDTWEIAVNMIGNGVGYACDTSYKKNVVTLVDLKEVEGELIAVLKYEIYEYIDGVFYQPSYNGKTTATETMMNLGFVAIADFSVDNGAWKSFEAMFFMDGNGAFNQSGVQKISLFSY